MKQVEELIQSLENLADILLEAERKIREVKADSQALLHISGYMDTCTKQLELAKQAQNSFDQGLDALAHEQVQKVFHLANMIQDDAKGLIFDNLETPACVRPIKRGALN